MRCRVLFSDIRRDSVTGQGIDRRLADFRCSVVGSRRHADSGAGFRLFDFSSFKEVLMFLTLVFIVALAVLYWFPARSWMGRWGSTPSDLNRVMAGDSLIVDHTYSGTLAVAINARPEHIWPWLVQMGYRRGGLYSYDWLDRIFGYLDRPSATRILPEFQHLAAGDEIPLGRGPAWPVAVVEPRRALVLDMRNMGGIDWVWQFGLYPIDDDRTLLVSRSRVRARTVWARLLTAAIEPAGFVMTRRMLLGIKQRAEALLGLSRQGDSKPADKVVPAENHAA
jgi:hypothetical protein